MSHIIYIWNVFVLPIKLAIFGCFTESVRNIPRNRLLLLSSRQDNFNIFPDKSIIKQDNISISQGLMILNMRDMRLKYYFARKYFLSQYFTPGDK